MSRPGLRLAVGGGWDDERAMGISSLPPLEDRPLNHAEAVAVVDRVAELLKLRYRSADLGNKDDPVDEAVYIMLSKQAKERAYQRAYAELRKRWPTWEDVRTAPLDDVAETIASVGFGPSNARTIKLFLDAVLEESTLRGFGATINLDWLTELDNQDAEAALVGLPGMGPKSARCVLSYSLGREVFAVDTHVRRIFDRLGIVASVPERKVKHEQYDAVVPPALRLQLHVNLVHHGRLVCRSRAPLCGACPLVSFCEQGRRRDVSEDDRPVAVELFAGGGGMGEGFSKNFRVAVAVENDRNAAQTYRYNHPGTVVLEADARHVTRHVLERLVPGSITPTLIMAGPPCQGYSAAGARDPEDEKNELFRAVTDLAAELRPRFVVIENVPGMRKVGGIGFVDAVVEALDAAGYDAGGKGNLLRACDYGVAQLRRRIIFLAQLKELGPPPSAPSPSHCPGWACRYRCGDEPGSLCGLPPTPTVIERLADLPQLDAGEIAEFRVVDGFALYNGSTMTHSQRVIDKISEIKPGTGPISYRRLHSDLARTIVAGHRALPVHPTLDRTLSVREAARIQSFQDSHVFCGKRGSQPLQVANAVPPLMAAAISDELARILESPVDPTERQVGDTAGMNVCSDRVDVESAQLELDIARSRETEMCGAEL